MTLSGRTVPLWSQSAMIQGRRRAFGTGGSWGGAASGGESIGVGALCYRATTCDVSSSVGEGISMWKDRTVQAAGASMAPEVREH